MDLKYILIWVMRHTLKMNTGFDAVDLSVISFKEFEKVGNSTP